MKNEVYNWKLISDNFFVHEAAMAFGESSDFSISQSSGSRPLLVKWQFNNFNDNNRLSSAVM